MKTIPLTKGKVAIVDDEDYESLSKFKWFALNGRYAARLNPDRRLEGQPHHIIMHRTIIQAPPELDVDHINMDGLDNRKANLRLVTHQENMLNYKSKPGTSKYKGVSKTKEGKWRTSFMFKGTHHYLGIYDNEEDAAKAYNIKAFELGEDFAYLNNVDHGSFKPKERRKSSSKYRGVIVKPNGKINAAIQSGGKNYFLGVFETEEDAALMYNFWAIDFFGENARLNVINKEETA